MVTNDSAEQNVLYDLLLSLAKIPLMPVLTRYIFDRITTLYTEF